MSTANLFNLCVYPAKNGLPVIAPAPIGDSCADNTLSSVAGCVWNRLPPEGRAPDTDGYDISEVRGDLRFSRLFIPILSPFLLSFSRGRYPCAPFPLPFPLRIYSRQSFSSSLLFFFFSSSRPHVSLVRFVSPPRCHPNSVHRLATTSREGEGRRGGGGGGRRDGEEGDLSLSFSVSRRIVFLFALVFVPSSNERMSKTTWGTRHSRNWKLDYRLRRSVRWSIRWSSSITYSMTLSSDKYVLFLIMKIYKQMIIKLLKDLYTYACIRITNNTWYVFIWYVFT